MTQAELMGWQRQLHERERAAQKLEQEAAQRVADLLLLARAGARGDAGWGPLALLPTLERVAREGIEGPPGQLQRAARKVARLWLQEWQQAAKLQQQHQERAAAGPAAPEVVSD